MPKQEITGPEAERLSLGALAWNVLRTLVVRQSPQSEAWAVACALGVADGTGPFGATFREHMVLIGIDPLEAAQRIGAEAWAEACSQDGA